MAIGSNFARRTPATLADLAQQYLAQPLPDISGIFTLPQASNIITPVVEEETVAAPGLTPEQLALLYPQGDGEGGGLIGGIGPTGDLDPNDTKDFFINGEIVTGYKNVKSGLYQDKDGLNIQNLGIRRMPGVTGILDSLQGNKQIKYPGYFDYYNAKDLITKPSTFFNFFKDQTPSGEDIARYRGLQKKTMQEARDITKRIQKTTPPTAQDLAMGGNNNNTGGGGGQDRFDGASSRAAYDKDPSSYSGSF